MQILQVDNKSRLGSFINECVIYIQSLSIEVAYLSWPHQMINKLKLVSGIMSFCTPMTHIIKATCTLTSGCSFATTFFFVNEIVFVVHVLN